MKGKIGNINQDTNFTLECLFCGGHKDLNLVAHRHFVSQNIRGFVVVCKECVDSKLQNNDWYFDVKCRNENEVK